MRYATLARLISGSMCLSCLPGVLADGSVQIGVVPVESINIIIVILSVLIFGLIALVLYLIILKLRDTKQIIARNAQQGAVDLPFVFSDAADQFDLSAGNDAIVRSYPASARYKTDTSLQPTSLNLELSPDFPKRYDDAVAYDAYDEVDRHMAGVNASSMPVASRVASQPERDTATQKHFPSETFVPVFMEKKPVSLPERESVSADIERHLKDDEQIIVNILKMKHGQCGQGTIVTVSGFSKAKVSQVLAELESRNVIYRKRKGRENLVILK